MHEVASPSDLCTARTPAPSRRRERGVLAVVVLTAVMMVVEIAVGYASQSMALLADGWHMATHVGALGLASAAYAVARRYASHRAFAFGTGKVHALAGYTSAVALGLVAAIMIVESAAQLLHPRPIDFASALPVAIVGLVVNIVSVLLLHGSEDHDHDEGDHDRHDLHEGGHDHHDLHEGDHDHHDLHEGDHDHHDHHDLHRGDHDHNHQAALMHVVADTLTSALAIVALLAGRFLGWVWLDSVSGIVAGLVILKWGAGLCRNAAFDLLDIDPSSALEEKIRVALESVDDVRVSDLHVWSLGRGAKSCVATVISSTPREPREYRERLAAFDLSHLTIEVRRCSEGHEGGLIG